eukprot:scaffold2834_cov156-Chaetoceros_neogracile.AAC.1
MHLQHQLQQQHQHQHQLQQHNIHHQHTNPLTILHSSARYQTSFRTQIQLGHHPVKGIDIVNTNISAVKVISFDTDLTNNDDDDHHHQQTSVGYFTRYLVEQVLPHEYLLRIARRGLANTSSTEIDGTVIQINYGDGYATKILIHKHSSKSASATSATSTSTSTKRQRRSSLIRLKQQIVTTRVDVRLSFNDDNGVGMDPQDLILDHMREKSMRRHGSNDVNFHNGRFRSLDLISLVLNTGPVCWDTDEFALEDSDKIRILKVWFRDDQPGIAIGIHVPSLGIEGKDQGGKVNGKVEVEGTSNLYGVRIRDDDDDDDDDGDQIVKSNSHVQRNSKKRSINDANDDNEVESQKPSGKRKADGVEETIRQTAQDQIEGEEPEQLQFQLPRKKGDEPNKDKLHERGEKVQSDSHLSKSASPASESSASSSPQTSLSNVRRDLVQHLIAWQYQVMT